MFKKLKRLFSRKKKPETFKAETAFPIEEIVENAYQEGYTNGMRDGMSIARAEAINSLRRALWQKGQTK